MKQTATANLLRMICVPVAAKIDKNNREKVPQKDDIAEELERDAEDKALTATGKIKDKAVAGEKTTKTEPQKKAKNDSVAESDEALAKKYGKAAARLAGKFREMDDDDDDYE